MFEEIDVDGVETLGLPVGKVELRFCIAEIGNQGLSGIALNAESFVVLVHEVAAVFGSFERKDVVRGG